MYPENNGIIEQGILVLKRVSQTPLCDIALQLRQERENAQGIESCDTLCKCSPELKIEQVFLNSKENVDKY